jgi:hypothetical protein
MRLAALIFLALFASPALAHEAPLGWSYPYACCANYDCKQYTGHVKESREGYVIDQTGEVISYGDKRIKDSPDGEFHWCAHQTGIDAGKTICLFVPPRGY